MSPLEEILTRLTDAIRQADFPQISALSAMLETVSPPESPAALRRAARLARDNGLALAASSRGLRAAQRRIAELRSGPSLTTYDRSGRKQCHTRDNGPTHRL